MNMKYLTALAALTVSAVLAGPASAATKGEFKCQDKGSMNYGTCKTLRGGMCTITVGDGTTVKMPCRDLRRL